MKKAEMEHHADRHRDMMNEARDALSNGDYETAVQTALAAGEYIDGMMRYRRKYEETEFGSVACIDLVLAHAPFLLDRDSLNDIADLLKSQRRIERNTNQQLSDKLEAAREKLAQLHRLWKLIEAHPEIRQDTIAATLGGDQDIWRAYAEQWEKMRILIRTDAGRSYCLELRTRLEEFWSGKCSSCGDTTAAPKSMFLEPIDCPNCQTNCQFILINRATLV